MSSTWYAHLGFLWNSPFIGSIWDTSHASDKYRFLQYALSQDSEGTKPAWFNFQKGDVLRFYIWDLGAHGSTPSTFNMSFSYLDTGEVYSPGSLVSVSSTSDWSDSTNNDNAYLQSTTFNGSPSSSCPWGSQISGYSVAGGVKFKTIVQCKLSFYLEVNSQIFVSDPEVIVGSAG